MKGPVYTVAGLEARANRATHAATDPVRRLAIRGQHHHMPFAVEDPARTHGLGVGAKVHNRLTKQSSLPLEGGLEFDLLLFRRQDTDIGDLPCGLTETFAKHGYPPVLRVVVPRGTL